ncbi:MAG: TrkA family potassium uptake protein [Actinomycetota bacterium]|nr:TrkA family potassium uptake protein [Actinomycetota bacterium]
MHVIIAGCGRVGAQLATELTGDGNDVVVIDKNPQAFRRLGEDFSGRTLTGIVFDRETLEEAGVKRAQAFVAVTSGDNSNVVSARTAKDRYGVERVVARIYDPQRAVIYERLGITTIASARWTAEAAMRALLPEGERIEGSIGPGGGDVVLLTMTVPDAVHGGDAAVLTQPGRSVLVAITREGSTHLPVANALLEGGDQLHLAVQRDAVDAVRARLHALIQGEH